MLVVKRKKDESITITTPDGTVIVVHIVRWTPSDVVVGVSAPREIEVLRSELIGKGRNDGWELAEKAADADIAKAAAGVDE